MTAPLRVLHCPGIVAGNPQQLARAERELGLESVAISLSGSAYGYETDEVVFAPDDGVVRQELKRFGLLRRALRDFDVIHLNFGQTIMPIAPENRPTSIGGRAYAGYAWLLEFRDLPLLKRAGKGIVATYQGDDARQGDYARAHFDLSTAHETAPGYYSPKGDAIRRHRIATVDRYADAIFALNPDLLHVLPRRAEFLPYSAVDVHTWTPVPPQPGIPVVLHAPTHRDVKGTRFVLDAVEQLRAEGVAFEFVLVEGLTREQARTEYERADVLVDQLLAGWYGGLAVEMMSLGKPAIAYIRHNDLDRVPADMREELPVIDARPDTILDVLRRYLTCERTQLPKLGQRARAYAERWHDPLAVAARTKATYERILARTL